MGNRVHHQNQDPQEEILKHQSSLLGHLSELKSRMLWVLGFFLVAFCLCYYYTENIYGFLVQPLEKIYSGQDGRHLIYTGLTEAFFTYLKLSFASAFILTFPFAAAQCYGFLAPGLYKKERKVILPYIILAPLLFFVGAATAYYVVFPIAWEFFLSFEKKNGMPIQLEARVSEYLALVIQLVIGFGMAFQMPVVLTLLTQMGLITGTGLAKKRRYAIIVIFIVAALLTPPDVVSQISLALPLLFLYECSVFICKRIEKTRQQANVENQIVSSV
jgi:sec-independent protein translocase protein TatC